MRDIIKKLYQSIVEDIPDLYEEIFFGAQDKKIKLLLEDVFPLCQLSIYDSEFMQDSDILDIIKMVFWAIGNHLEEGFQELVKGLEYIYQNVNMNTRIYIKDMTVEDYIHYYLISAIVRYEDDDFILLGKIISENPSIAFKEKIVEVLKKCICYFKEDEENEDRVEEKGN